MFFRQSCNFGVTCDSGAIRSGAMHSDILHHEARVMNRLSYKPRFPMHSTVSQMGAFAMQIRVRMIVFYHFSSRYDLFDPEHIKSGEYKNQMAPMRFYFLTRTTSLQVPISWRTKRLVATVNQRQIFNGEHSRSCSCRNG